MKPSPCLVSALMLSSVPAGAFARDCPAYDKNVICRYTGDDGKPACVKMDYFVKWGHEGCGFHGFLWQCKCDRNGASIDCNGTC